MARTMVLPAGVRYLGELAAAGSSTGVAAISDRVASTVDTLVAAIHDLEHAQHAAHEAGSVRDEAVAFRETVIPAQGALRAAADELETLVADDLWPMPKYRELLFQY
jgi:glutamine synthetase